MKEAFPDWQPGQKIEAPFSSMKSIAAAELQPAEIYKLMIGSIVPRPIAFVSTQNKGGKRNLSPFSFFNGVSSDPPCLSVCFTKKPNGDKKDSLINIEETGEFVVNTVSTWFARAMVHTAADYPYGVDEMEQVGLTPIPSLLVKPPRVKESPVHFECQVYKVVPIGDGGKETVTMVIGKIVQFHFADTAFKEGKIIFDALDPVARLGGATYGVVDGVTSMPIPKL